MTRRHFAAFALVSALGTVAGPSSAAPALHAQGAGAAPAQQAQTGGQVAAAPPGNAANGRKLFVSDGCYQCHGYEAQGSTATGPRLGPRPVPFAYFSRYVRRPTNQMPPFTAKVLSDAELADIYAFLQSVAPPVDVATIPILK